MCNSGLWELQPRSRARNGALQVVELIVLEPFNVSAELRSGVPSI